MIRSLLPIAAKAGIRPKLLLLDRGFFSVELIRYLQAALCVSDVGDDSWRKADHAKGPSGTRVFALRKRSGWDTYTMTNADQKSATFQVWRPLP